VYFLDTTGKACPDGTGLSAAGAALPSSPLAFNPATLQANGLPSNKLVEITDPLAATSPASGESFRTGQAARFAEVLRGVSFTSAR
jgi:hypothetical protein